MLQKMAENLSLVNAGSSQALVESGAAACDAQLARLQETMLQLQKETEGLREVRAVLAEGGGSQSSFSWLRV